MQREQLEVAQTANQKLNQDIQRLTKQWEEFSQQLREKKITDSGQQGAGSNQELATTHQTVGSLWKEILDFRRQMSTVKVFMLKYIVSPFKKAKSIYVYYMCYDNCLDVHGT